MRGRRFERGNGVLELGLGGIGVMEGWNFGVIQPSLCYSFNPTLRLVFAPSLRVDKEPVHGIG
jgi:hypothetical protein